MSSSPYFTRSSLLAFVVAVAVATSACSSTSSSAEPDGAPFVSACDSPGSIASITPDVPIDYVSRRAERRGTSVWTQSVDEEAGAPCATAKDVAACKKKVADTRVLTAVCTGDLSVPGQGCSTRYLLYTRGDDVRVAQSPAEMTALIGHVDNLYEATLVAALSGIQSGCNLPDGYVQPEYRLTPDGFEIVTFAETCTERFEVHVLVGFDQTIRELSRRRIPGNATCVELPA